jgi:hypothetical protein
MPLLQNCPTGDPSMGISNNMPSINFKRKNRWMFSIPGIAGTGGTIAIPALPPKQSARPSLSFKEVEFQHLNESIWYPMKPDWKPINLILFDLACNQNGIFNWIQQYYDPTQDGLNTLALPAALKQPMAQLELYDGCANTLECWTYENVYPQNIEFGELDMESSDIVMVNITLRYDRAYVIKGGCS